MKSKNSQNIKVDGKHLDQQPEDTTQDQHKKQAAQDASDLRNSTTISQNSATSANISSGGSTPGVGQS